MAADSPTRNPENPGYRHGFQRSADRLARYGFRICATAGCREVPWLARLDAVADWAAVYPRQLKQAFPRCAARGASGVGAETTSAAVTWPSACLGRPAVPPPAPRCVSFSGSPWRSLATWTRPVATRQTENDGLS